MESGKLRETILILSPPASQDEYGAKDPNAPWDQVANTRASFEPLMGREYFIAAETRSNIEVKFHLRYIPGVEANFRVRHRTIEYDIISPINVDGRNRELILYCKKVTT